MIFTQEYLDSLSWDELPFGQTDEDGDMLVNYYSGAGNTNHYILEYNGPSCPYPPLKQSKGGY